ncbi:DUF2062 domain-containing protein [Rhodophyticola sp. SM2404]
MFKRRDQRPWARILTEWVYPRGGWTRAFQYVQHRLSRLPGTPESIARGIFVGAFTSFTPFFGIHFVVAAVLAKMVRGNILAALLGTFVGNPLTYVPIALVSLEFGHFMLGTEMRGRVEDGLFHKFGGALGDLWHNIQAVFTHERAHWDELHIFYDDVFFPWMVGGIIPGVICGIICYYLSVPVIRAYQKRRVARMQKKIRKMREQAGASGTNH